MNELSAQHYLKIYRMRLKMAEEGITHPKPVVVEGVRRLVACLSELSPDAKIRLETEDGKAIFIVANTGDLLVELDFTDDA